MTRTALWPPWLLPAILTLVAACSGGSAQTAGAGTDASPSAAPAVTRPLSTSDVDYSDANAWLCRPGKAGGPCAVNLDATVVESDGSRTPEPFVVATDPKVDCFYVYPTVSTDPGQNSDMTPGAAENNVVIAQAARFGSVCRLFAPVYRQVTVTALNKGIANFIDPAAHDLAYHDVIAAFESYLALDNRGRPFVLIGHSQGSMHLTRLIREQIDPDPALRARLVSALLIGTSVKVPPGADVGGDFKNVPACRRPEQVGCVVAYSSFNDLSPPPANSLFGRGGVLCVNPAAPGGGPAALRGYYGSAGNPVAVGVTTPYFSPRGVIAGECVNENGASYLKITAPGTAIPPYISGPQWGLHVLDVTLAIGDLVSLVRTQAASFGSR